MFKNILLTVVLATAPFAALAHADDTALKGTGTVTLQSDYVYRGQSTGNGVSTGVDVRFDNLVLPGLFVTGDFNSTHLLPVNSGLTIRSDVGVGYAFSAANANFEVSANRVFNPLFYSADYNELRARAAYGPVFVELGQGITSNVNRNTYVAVGAQTKLLSDKLTVGGKVSAVHYNLTDFGLGSENHFNNAEAYATYNVWHGLDVFTSYSYGGKSFAGQDVGNRFWGGLQYRF